jgi:hypothetical protein
MKPTAPDRTHRAHSGRISNDRWLPVHYSGCEHRVDSRGTGGIRSWTPLRDHAGLSAQSRMGGASTDTARNKTAVADASKGETRSETRRT